MAKKFDNQRAFVFERKFTNNTVCRENSTTKKMKNLQYTLLMVLLINNLLLFITEIKAQNSKSLDEFSKIYNKSNEVDKYIATQFLIKQIPFKYSYEGDIVKKFNAIFPILESLQTKKMIGNQDPTFQAKWDSLVQKFGLPIDGDVKIIPDSAILNTDTFKENIDLAFKVKDEKLWLHNIKDSIFYEYILPYRLGTERLEKGWRNHLYDTYNNVIKKGNGKQENFDKIKNTDLVAFAGEIEWEIKRKVSTNGTMWNYPFDITVSDMEKGKQGACRHLVKYTEAVMRSVGIPVGIDFTLCWGNNRTGHQWNVLFTPENKPLPFDACSYPLSIDLSDRKIVKVYREQFSITKNFVSPPISDVPSTLYDLFWKDVTQEYVKTSDITLNVPAEIQKSKKYVLIGTFNNTKWEPQYYAPINNGKATFKKMGRNNIYIGMYENNIKIETFGNPFILDSLGVIHELIPNSSKMTMTVKRKFHRSNAVNFYEVSMVGGKFECSNTLDFNNPNSLFAITEQPDSVETRNLSLTKAYRYYRFTLSSTAKPYIAEFELYDDKGKHCNIKPLESDTIRDLYKISDHDLNTFYWGKSLGTITYDLGKPVKVSKIKFAPRSDSNYIIEGDSYALCYWNINKWVNISMLTAAGSKLEFTSVPDNAVFLLHDFTRGNEERIFTYENGNQIWW